jgi:UDP-galactopyranose mutase
MPRDRGLLAISARVAYGGGRFSVHRYFNMDQAILNALEMFDNLRETGKLAPKRRPQDFGPGDGDKH